LEIILYIYTCVIFSVIPSLSKKWYQSKIKRNTAINDEVKHAMNILNRKGSGNTGIMTDSASKVIIYQSELDYLSKCILESPNIETGGNIFGLCTPFGIPMVYYVVGPGPNAVHNVTHFRQDFDFLERNADYLVEEHALHHIGSWHSHHSLGLTQPSQGDSASTLEGMRECGLNSFLLIIGNCKNGKSSVRPYRYHSDGRCELLRWIVLPGLSPIRKVYDDTHSDWIYIPKGVADMEPLDTSSLVNSNRDPKIKITYPQSYWLNDPNNKKEFMAIMQFLNSKFDSVKIYQKEDHTIEVQVVKGVLVLKIHFEMNFPTSAPKIYAVKGSEVKFSNVCTWSGEKSIKESFIKLIETIDL